MMQLDTELLKKRVKQSGLTQGKLAEKTNLSRNTILNILSGVTTPSYYAMISISYVLKLSSEDIMSIFFKDHQFPEGDPDIINV